MSTEATTKPEIKKLPKRIEVPTELTWDLSVVYADDAAWEADFARVESMMGSFPAMQDAFIQSAQNLLQCLQLRDEIGTVFGRVRSYASLRRSEDNGNAEAQARSDRSQMLGTRLASATAFIEPQILSLSPEQLRDFAAQEPGLKLYDYYFETLERRRPHVRSAEVEDVLAQAQEAMNGTDTVFALFNNADLKFPPVHDENGQEAELSHGRYLSFLENRDRRVREEAFRTMHGEYFKWRNTLAATLSGAIKANVCNARVRHYESALQAALAPDDIPVEVYHNLISTVRERLPVLHRYLRLRKKLLGLEDLQMWDLYVPMVADIDRPVPYEQAQKMVRDAVQPLGSKYAQVLQQGFESRWVDVLENEGKTSGAFSD
ncbi:MAG: oligoendopeptidase F, partial [Abitibacteriaceae bacterium]|nr:oligoendopeptidase F [Abditibacteriaceae bacterium]